MVNTETLRDAARACAQEGLPMTAALLRDAARTVDDQAAEIARLKAALEWYRDQTKSMGRAAIRGDSKAMLALMHDVAVDGGGRARAALQEKSNG